MKWTLACVLFTVTSQTLSHLTRVTPNMSGYARSLEVCALGVWI